MHMHTVEGFGGHVAVWIQAQLDQPGVKEIGDFLSYEFLASAIFLHFHHLCPLFNLFFTLCYSF